MRTTLSLDEDILAAARSLARARSESIGRVLSDLARRGLEASPRKIRRKKGAFPIFNVPKGGRLITLEDVKRAEEDNLSILVIPRYILATPKVLG
jgi:hypothetical protein